MKKTLCACLFIITGCLSQVAFANQYAEHVDRVFDAFCLDPEEDSISKLDFGIEGCFEDRPKVQFNCIQKTAYLAWFDLLVRQDPQDAESAEKLTSAIFDANKACKDQSLSYKDVVTECLDLAQKNKFWLNGVYFFNKECVDFEDLAKLKEEIQVIPSLLSEVIHTFENQFLHTMHD